MRQGRSGPVGVIAVDGTKVHANASRDQNRDFEQIAREILEEAKAVDAAEDGSMATRAAMSWPRTSPPARAGAGVCATPVASLKSNATASPGRSRATAPSA